MADLKISQLTDGGGLLADDEVAVNRSAASFKARGIGVDGWISDTSETWTFATFTAGPPAVGTFTVSGDLRSKYTVGTRIKLTQTTVKYFVVSADPTFSGGNTTVTITGGTDYTLANAAISVNYHSYAANPQGYPSWFACASGVTGFSATTTNAARFSVTGRTCIVEHRVQGTSNATGKTTTLPIASAQSANFLPNVIVGVADNGGSNVVGLAFATAASTITWRVGLTTSASWTASGTATLTGTLVYEV